MKWKSQVEAIDKSNSINVCRTLVDIETDLIKYPDLSFTSEGDDEGKQWGKPGPGGAYWRESALTGDIMADDIMLHNDDLSFYLQIRHY